MADVHVLDSSALQESGQQEADRRWVLMKQLPVEIVWEKMKGRSH